MEEYRILLSERNALVFRLILSFKYVYLPKRVPLIVISLYERAGDTQMIINTQTGISKVYKGTQQIRYYHNYNDAIKAEYTLARKNGYGIGGFF